MTNLTLHIEYLLLHHDCVTVPGLGAFINVRVPASINESDGTVTPMMREVRFNPSVCFEDGLIASSFARKYGMTFEDARSLVKKETDALKETLQSEGEVTLGDLGILRLGEDKTIQFVPMHSAESMMEEIGYHKVSLIRDHHEDDQPSAEQSENYVSVAEDVTEYDDRGDRYYHIYINKTFARVAASLLVLAVVALSIILPESNQTRTMDKASVMPLIDSVFTDTVTESEAFTADHELVVDTENDTRATGSEQEIESRHKYHLIIGTFSSIEEARRYMDRMEGCGFELEALQSRKLCRVSARSSDSFQELLDLLNSKDFRESFGEAWIWTEE